jgi:transcriptional regulator with XRE-family HTH domain
MRKITLEEIERMRNLRSEKGLSLRRIAEIEGVPYDVVNDYVGLFEKGFVSLDEYDEDQKEYLAERGINSLGEYMEYLKKQRELQDEMRKKMVRTYDSQDAKSYPVINLQRRLSQGAKKYQARNKERPENKRMSRIIETRIRKSGRSIDWFAEKMNIPSRRMRQYLRAEDFPDEGDFEKMRSFFNLPYNTIDDFING